MISAYVNHASARHDHGALDRVLELPDVALPGGLMIHLISGVVESLDFLAMWVGESGQEFVRQQRDVPHAAEQWQQIDLDDGQAIVEIFANQVVLERFCRSLFVAATMRISTSISFLPPRRRTVRVSMARRSFT